MDRPLDAGFQRQRTVRRVVLAGGLTALVSGVLWWGPGWISPSVSRSRIRTARVDAGPIEAVITASGIVMPEVEEVISSPVTARVLRILRRAGTQLAPGDPIVELDTSEAALAVEKLTRNLALKENQQAQAKLELERRLNDLDSQTKIKALQLQSFRSQLVRNRQLFKEGLTSAEELRQSELAEAQAVIELKQLENERVNAERATSTQLEGLALEMATLRQEVQEARRQLELASPRASRPGVLTWTLTEEGTTIGKGDVIARIADLTSFRVDATVSDVHAKQLAVGLPVAVKIGDDTLDGRIATILPTIQNGIITIHITLADRSNPLLRSNLRVDALIVTGRKAKVLRIKKGPFADGDGRREVFVIRGGRAVKVPVELGLASFDEYEVVRGLSAGDEVIISDTRDYMHLRELRVR
jgi:HlyD family secretion protein